MFPKIDTKKFNIVNDEKFALDLLKEKKILLVHGGGFNWHQPDHFRVVYLPRIEVLKKQPAKSEIFWNITSRKYNLSVRNGYYVSRET